jgi:hypothetical protein
MKYLATILRVDPSDFQLRWSISRQAPKAVSADERRCKALHTSLQLALSGDPLNLLD